MTEPTVASATPAPAAGISRVTLKHPVVIDGLKCEYLDLRRPKVRDLLHVDKVGGTDAEKEIAQFANLAGVAPKTIEELDLADYLALQKQVQAFLS